MKECDDGKQLKLRKLSDLAKETEIVKLDKEGLGLTAIARKIGISRGSVYGILAKVRAGRAMGDTSPPDSMRNFRGMK